MRIDKRQSPIAMTPPAAHWLNLPMDIRNPNDLMIAFAAN